ncbi:DNA topoisomerase I, mitochondrial isoform X1 [Cimex lectularius]|uniref:DNA topoisomerase I n=1 Tax=Cimex lectularius TaxID=79782 RepID=A0A8I6RJY4_CIMLE|nr:DNA topoisomerase I, mitochondrial isoform X1 [Cimex lectularius]
MDSEGYVENGHGESVIHSSEKVKSEYNPSEGTPLVNGISNGLGEKHKKKEHRDRDRDGERRKDKDRHRDKEHKDKDRNRDKDKEKHRDKDKEHRHSSSSHRDKDKEKSKDGHNSSSKDKDKDKDRQRDKDKDRHRDEKKESSSHKDRDREKEKSSSSSSHKDKDKEHSKHNSSSSKSHSSSKDKHSSSSSSKDKERSDKHREKDKKHSSSSSDRKHGSSSGSSKDKERKDKDKDRKEDKHRKSSSGDSKEKVEHAEPIVHIKKEEVSFIKEEEESFELKEEVKKEEFYDENDFKEEDDDDSYNLHIETTMEESTFKEEEDSEEDIPLSSRKHSMQSDEDDDVPLTSRKKLKTEKQKSSKKRKKSFDSEEEEEDDFKPVKTKAQKKSSKVKQEQNTSATQSPRKKRKLEEEQEVWKWWEEEKKPDGVKWNFLEHKGPVFAPPYEPLPHDVKFYYDGKEVRLSEEAEEVATFYGRMIEHDYTQKEVFNNNFFKDWKKTMTPKERELITDLSKCNFRHINAYFQKKSEERKAMTKEEKAELKKKNEEQVQEYGFCIIDGHKEKIGNFKIEPPSLFRGRGEHPKMGMLKKRVMPEDVSINCSKDSKIPVPPPGHKWKEVKHDNTVTWLASWTENVQGQVKYVMLNPSSKLKGEKDWQKYETARKLASQIDKIRRDYREDWKSKEMKIRQRAVAMYFIDKLALRAGNEKDEDQADTVGCCSLRVEHIQLFPEKDGKEYVVVFDFLGKDSIRYYNEVPVEKRVFKNLQLFIEGKKGSDDLFDRLNTTVLNKHLTELMDGLTAKVFRTYNASWTLQQQLNELTKDDYTLPEMCLAYNRANRAVAILCNHQRSVPKSHQKSMENLKEKISNKREQIEEAEKQYKYAKKDAKNGSAKEKIVADKKKKALERLKEQLRKLEVQETDREENKTIALGTSKLNYLDPRISVAWCKKHNVPIEKVYNKTQRDKFRWAIDMAGPDYVF